MTTLTVAALGAAGVFTATTLTGAAAASAVSGSVPTLSPFNVPGRGATVPFVEQEAEYAASNGTVIGPDRLYGHLASEASGRQAVTLSAVGQYVEFTLTAPANSIDFRYSIPDTADGKGRDASIDLQINGSTLKSVPVTSRYSWYYGGYPFNNNPGDTNPHHFFDEARTLFGSTYPIGTKVRLQVSSTSQSPSFTIDLADFENVPDPIAKPTGAIDAVADFGADPTGATDSTAKIQAAVNAGQAQGRTVYVPQGNYTLYDHVIVDGVTLAGAGPWYTVFGGRDPVNRNRAAGIYGKYVTGGGYTGAIRPQEAGGPSRNVTLKDFAIIGDIQERVDDDQVNGLGGAMTNSVVDDLWIQHTKVGAWMDGPMDNFTIKNSRILDQTADGVNFHTGVTNSTVTNTFLRNTGDDGLASWPQNVPNVGDSFTHDTMVLPILANNIVTYGGKDFTISDDVMADTITNGGGLHIANRYPGVTAGAGTSVSGTITAARNTLIRTGNNDFNWQFGVGAIWFDGLNGPITGATINVTDTDILDSSYEAIQTIEGPVSGINLTNVNIDGAGTYAIQAQVAANMTFTNVKAKNIAQAATPEQNCVGSSFVIVDGGGNSGWNTGSVCTGTWPNPVWTYGGVPTGGSGGGGGSNPPTVSPASLNFGAVNVGSSAGPKTLTLSNPGTTAVTVSSIVATAPFSQNNNCGSSLAAGASCTVNVTFTPTAGGAANGTLSVTNSGTTTPISVSLSGTGVSSTTNLALTATMSASSSTGGFPATNANDNNTSTYWESSNNVFPQWLQADLGTAQSIGSVTLTLPPLTSWGARTQTLAIQGSQDGTNFTNLVGSAGYVFDPATGNTVTVSLPAGTNVRYLRLNITGNTGWPAGQISEFQIFPGGGTGGSATFAASPTSLTFANQLLNSTSAAKTVTVSNTGTAAASIASVTVSGPFAQTNNCGSSLAAGASCTVNATFTPTVAAVASGAVTVSGSATNSPLSISLTGTGVTAGTATLAASPTSLAFGNQAVGSTSAAKSVTVTNTGTQNASVSSVSASGAFAQTNNCGTSIAAGASCTVNVTFTPTAAGAASGSVTVTSSATNSPLTVGLTGTGTVATNANLALHQPTTESGHTQNYASGNAVDGDTGTYWESVDNAFPQWLQVDLGSSVSVGRVVLTLPPAWGTRTQTLSIQGSTNGTTFTTLAASATYTFNPSSGNNTVTITFPASSARFVRANFTANSGWPAGQVSEFEVFAS